MRTGKGSLLTRRQAIQAGTASMAAAYLSACGGSDPSTGAAASSGPVDVLWDYSYGGTPGSMRRYWTEMRRRVNASDDAGVTITGLQEVPIENLAARLQAAHTARRGPVLEPVFPGWSSFKFLQQDVLEPLDGQIDAADREDWILTSTINDKLYIAPYYAEVAPLMVNRRMLERAGVDVDTRFASWEAFTDALRRLARTGVTPLLMGGSDQLGIEKLVAASEMAFWDARGQLAAFALGQLGTDEPVVSGWIDHLAELQRDGLLNDDAAQITENESIERFLAGDGAVIIAYPGSVYSAQNASEFRVLGLWDGPGQLSAPLLGAGSGLAMTTYGENKDGAANLLKFQQRPDIVALFAELTGELPCNSSFDASGLQGPKAEAWELMSGGDATTVDSPHNYLSHLPTLLAVSQRALAGQAPVETRRELEDRVRREIDRNPAEAQLLEQFIESV